MANLGTLRSIGCGFERLSSSIQPLFAPILWEREKISRGLIGHLSLRSIARRVSRTYWPDAWFTRGCCTFCHIIW